MTRVRYARPATPKNSADVRAVTDSTVEARLISTGQIVNLGGPEEFGAAIAEQRARLAAIAKDLGIKPSQ